MKRYTVELAPTLVPEIREINLWWAANRPASPSLFAEELATALARLESHPGVGTAFKARPGFHRIGMLRTRYFLYYLIDDEQMLVRVQAVWHWSRGEMPPLH